MVRFLPLAAGAAILLSPISTYAFMPYDFREEAFGKGGVSHETITRTAFDSLAYGWWPFLTGITGQMSKARDTIMDANCKVDDDQKHSSRHFDGENFLGGQYVLTGTPGPVGKDTPKELGQQNVDLFHLMQGQLEGGLIDDARKALGRALHTLQDFYAHSNWVEMGYTTVNDALGVPGKTINQVADDANTCVECGDLRLGTLDALACEASCAAALPTSRLGFNLGALLYLEYKKLTGQSPNLKQSIFYLWCLDSCVCPNCDANIIPTNGRLTSGYYFGEDRLPRSGKCHHGGHGDNAVGSWVSNPSLSDFLQHGAALFNTGTPGINKDSLDCSWSPHGPKYHTTAWQLALQATEKFVKEIRLAIQNAHGEATAELRMRQLFGLGPTVAFVVDTTGSMDDVIDGVRSELIKIVEKRIGTADQPIKYALAPFNDPAGSSVLSTSDVVKFEANANSLYAAGGGDCPEPSMQGILNALNVLDKGSTLFLITDASIKDTELISTVKTNAKSKGVAVWTFEFDSSCSEDNGYSDIATYTGGRYFYLQRSEARAITAQIDTWLKADFTNIAQYSNVPSVNIPFMSMIPHRRRDGYTYAIPIDSSVKAVYFSLGGSMTLSVTRPDGSPVVNTDGGVSLQILSGGTFLNVEAPPVGVWTVSVIGDGQFNLTVSADSSIQFDFSFAQYRGRPDHSGWGPTDDAFTPSAWVDYPALAFIEGTEPTNVTYQIRNLAGDMLSGDIPFIQGTGEEGFPSTKSFFGFVDLPAGNCLVYVTGKSKEGDTFLRVYPSQIAALPSNGTNNGTINGSTSASPSASASLPMAGDTTGAPYPIINGTGLEGPANSLAGSVSIPVVTGGVTGGSGSSVGGAISSNSGSGNGTGTDITTIIVTSTTAVCPAISVVTSNGNATTTLTTSTMSTIHITVTSVVPCSKCHGPNYPSPTVAPKPPSLQTGDGECLTYGAGGSAYGAHRISEISHVSGSGVSLSNAGPIAPSGVSEAADETSSPTTSAARSSGSGAGLGHGTSAATSSDSSPFLTMSTPKPAEYVSGTTNSTPGFGSASGSSSAPVSAYTGPMATGGAAALVTELRAGRWVGWVGASLALVGMVAAL